VPNDDNTPAELSLPELMPLLKEHEITRYSHMNKAEIIKLLRERGVVPHNYFAGRREKMYVVLERLRRRTQKQSNSQRWGWENALTLIDNATDRCILPIVVHDCKIFCNVTNFNGTRIKSNADSNIYLINVLDPTNVIY
jgi:hypothetical protein